MKTPNQPSPAVTPNRNVITPSVVIFDLGKVLVDFDYLIAARKIAARCKMEAGQVKHFIAQSPLLFKLETGLITSEEFFKGICDATGFCGDIEEFSSFFSDVFTPIPEMIQLQADLRQRGFPTYILSNTNDLAVTHIRRSFPFFANFDGHILSYEQRSMKPDSKIYEAAERFSGKSGREILYLDDLPENIAAGAARGWQVILQESPQKTRAAIEKLGLLSHT
jgi:FMN phosphatase YigB (HAD superfamily)